MVSNDVAAQLYERLMQLVHGEWRTDAQVTSDEGGRTRLRCFYGQHRVEAAPNLAGTFDLCRKGERCIEVQLRPVL